MNLVGVDLTIAWAEQAHVRSVAERVAGLYTGDRVAQMKYAPVTSIDSVNLDGFGAEYAVAQILGLPWQQGVRGRADVGHNVEVRQSRHAEARLLLYRYDKADRIFVLVTGIFPVYTVRGWLQGREGFHQRYFTPAGGMAPWGGRTTVDQWVIPQTDLHNDLLIR